MNDHETHQLLREQLGSYVLGHLDDNEAVAVRAHLDGCPSCRAELAELDGVAAALATLDATSFARPSLPPADLGERIRDAVRGEQRTTSVGTARRRLAAGAPTLLAAAVLLAAVLGGGVLLGRATGPDPGSAVRPTVSPTLTVTASPTPVPTEQIALTSTSGSAVAITSSVLVNHTWGTELRIEATGFRAGTVYRAAFRERDGSWVPAGEFLGVGTRTMTCNLQSAALRAEVTEVALTDPSGDLVASAPL